MFIRTNTNALYNVNKIIINAGMRKVLNLLEIVKIPVCSLSTLHANKFGRRTNRRTTWRPPLIEAAQ